MISMNGRRAGLQGCGGTGETCQCKVNSPFVLLPVTQYAGNCTDDRFDSWTAKGMYHFVG